MLSGIRLFAMAALALASVAAHAEESWPSRPVRWIVPFGAGGTADAAARHITQKLSERWGQQIIIDNRPGANTAIAAAEAARAKPDGYTLFQPMNSTLTVNPYAFSKLPYDPVRDFTPIGVIASVPLIIVANDSLPAATLKDFVAQARKNPGQLTLGGGDVGVQLAAERFLRDADIDVQYVPYKTGADVMRGLLSREIQTGLDGVPAYPSFLKSGKLRALATNSPRRIASLPDVPTLGELGFKSSEAPLWHALVAPAGLPVQIQKKIASDLQAVLAMPDLKARMGELGLDPTWVGTDDFVALIARESAQMRPLVKALGIKLN
ncbi:Bug family tripartite tricarboxylate transporter substrate binding protein [Bordetella petrii]|uniref:Bug family tripartite tricarboxylate transporter substrate binding protein n=1 Tax=Bordetella petrii TaxID=94624 RepID=UPI001E550ECD|nr:tripartite tricarboxylate transporter substrate binding protein [Bordetella petrii]MCD0501763.1 tripartite tricarboxylate transporter substrate binding protein [Bordetella petrii]